MTSGRELKLVYSVAVILFIVGLLCYAAFPSTPPEEPIRIQYRSATGNVLFQHAQHTTGYDAACFDCHHHPSDDEAALIACGECHVKNPPENAPPPDICLDCHEAEEIEDSGIPAKTDAFHQQCTGCHRDIGAGPQEQACAECHIQ